MIAVTGGSGFIGSRVARALAAKGHEVVVWDLVPPPNGLPWREVDILDDAGLREATTSVDVICHLVGPVAEAMNRDPQAGRLLQLEGTRKLLDVCRRGRIRKVLLASSFYVYEGTDPQATVDEASKLATPGVFGRTKLLAEQMVTEWAAAHDRDYALLRIGSTYGSGRCTNLVKDLLESALSGRPFVVWGSGERRNQYTFVDDVGDGFLRALEGHGTYNLVSPEVHTTREVAELVSHRHGLQVGFDESKSEPPSFAYVAPRRAIEELGWRPRPLDALLDSVAEELRKDGRV